MTDQIYNDRYQGNPNLKRANVPIEYTDEQLEEYIKCAHDCEYFIEKYVRIVHIDHGLIPFNLYPFQKKMVNAFVNDRFTINKLPRQSGKSTTVTAYMMWRVLFHDNQNIAILANRGMLARELLSKITMAYEHLPTWLQQGVITWNRGNIELENGSKIVAAATSASSIRGGSYNLIFLDEFAFVEAYLAEQFFSSVYPTISSGQTSQVIIVSTPNGLNHFYKMWVDAEEGRSSYRAIEVHWTEVPGRDEAWKKETIANTSEEQFRQEFECEFIGSTNTLINATKLRNMAFVTPISQHGPVDVFEDPLEKHTYTITVDTSRGLNLDYSAFTVIDVTQLPYKVVAKYRSNTVAPMIFPSAIVNTAKTYNDAFCLVEINDIGQQVADIMHHELEYENILTTVTRGRAGQQISAGFTRNVQFGVKTTKQVKGIGCASLKTLIENDQLIITDFHIISELASFVQKGSSYEAESGQYDDLAMTLVLFAWLTNQTYFKEITDVNIREKIYKLQQELVEQDVLPFGMIDDGTDESFVDTEGQRWMPTDSALTPVGNPDSTSKDDFVW
jgi:hypothetical protein